jgi:hypothetical protein
MDDDDRLEAVPLVAGGANGDGHQPDDAPDRADDGADSA